MNRGDAAPGSTTGEAHPEHKRPGDAVYAGTIVRTRHGAGTVASTGRATKLGAIVSGLRAARPPIALERGLTRFAGLLAWVTEVDADSAELEARCAV